MSCISSLLHIRPRLNKRRLRGPSSLSSRSTCEAKSSMRAFFQVPRNCVKPDFKRPCKENTQSTSREHFRSSSISSCRHRGSVEEEQFFRTAAWLVADFAALFPRLRPVQSSGYGSVLE